MSSLQNTALNQFAGAAKEPVKIEIQPATVLTREEGLAMLPPEPNTLQRVFTLCLERAPNDEIKKELGIGSVKIGALLNTIYETFKVSGRYGLYERFGMPTHVPAPANTKSAVSNAEEPETTEPSGPAAPAPNVPVPADDEWSTETRRLIDEALPLLPEPPARHREMLVLLLHSLSYAQIAHQLGTGREDVRLICTKDIYPMLGADNYYALFPRFGTSYKGGPLQSTKPAASPDKKEEKKDARPKSLEPPPSPEPPAPPEPLSPSIQAYEKLGKEGRLVVEMLLAGKRRFDIETRLATRFTETAEGAHSHLIDTLPQQMGAQTLLDIPTLEGLREHVAEKSRTAEDLSLRL